MDSIVLKVKIQHSDRNLENLLRQADPVQNVHAEYETVERFGDYEGQQDVLLISDSIKALIPYFSKKESGVMIIFAGDSSLIFQALTFFPQNILNIWLTGMPDEYIKFEFNRAMKRMLMRYDAWLYKSWLISLIDSLQDLVWFKDKAGLHWLVNDKFENTVHKTREMIHGKGHNYIWDVPPEDGGKSEFRCQESEREVMEKKEIIMADELVKTDMGMRHFITYKAPLYDRDGEVAGTVGVGHDMTDFNNTSIELSMLIDNIPMSVMICNKDWQPVQANRRFLQLFKMSMEELKALDYHAWKKNGSKTLKPRSYNEQQKLYSEEVSVICGGRERILIITEQEVLDYFGKVTGYYCFFRDVTGMREYEQMILKYANTDSLTGLYNRRFFFEHLNGLKGEPMTVLFMDMDNFKKVNDTLGHNKGDEVLLTTSEMIQNIYSDCLVARLGGDEFAVLANADLSEEELNERAGRLVKTLEEAFAPMNLGVSISVGMAHTEGDIEDVDAFINESDQMMYEVKQAKKRGS